MLILTRRFGEWTIVRRAGKEILRFKVRPGQGGSQVRITFDIHPDIEVNRHEIDLLKYPAGASGAPSPGQGSPGSS